MNLAAKLVKYLFPRTERWKMYTNSVSEPPFRNRKVNRVRVRTQKRDIHWFIPSVLRTLNLVFSETFSGEMCKIFEFYGCKDELFNWNNRNQIRRIISSALKNIRGRASIQHLDQMTLKVQKFYSSHCVTEIKTKQPTAFHCQTPNHLLKFTSTDKKMFTTQVLPLSTRFGKKKFMNFY